MSEIPLLLPVTPECETQNGDIQISALDVDGLKLEGKGDSAFNGNATTVKTRARLDIVKGGKSVELTMAFRATEKQSDWTEVAGKVTRNVYNSHSGWKVTRVVTPSVSDLDVYTHVAKDNPIDTRKPGGPVHHVSIAIDEDDATRSKVTFNFVTVHIEEMQTGNCIPAKKK